MPDETLRSGVSSPAGLPPDSFAVPEPPACSHASPPPAGAAAYAAGRTGGQTYDGLGSFLREMWGLPGGMPDDVALGVIMGNGPRGEVPPPRGPVADALRKAIKDEILAELRAGDLLARPQTSSPPAGWSAPAQDQYSWPAPDERMLADPVFNAIWSVVREWDVMVPGAAGYCGANGSHARAIFDAIHAAGGAK